MNNNEASEMNAVVMSWDHLDEEALREGMAISVHRQLDKDTREALGLTRAATRSQTKRQGMVRGSIGAKARSQAKRVDSFTAARIGKRIPLGEFLRLSELREEKE